MPWVDNFRDIICSLGSGWTAAYVQHMSTILSFPLVFPTWRDCSHPFLLLSASFSPLFLAICQYSRFLRWPWRHAPSFRNQLHILDFHRFHLQLLRPPLPLQMVDALQLHTIGGTRCWCYRFHVCDIFHATGMEKRRCFPQLVGQHCMDEYCRC